MRITVANCISDEEGEEPVEDREAGEEESSAKDSELRRGIGALSERGFSFLGCSEGADVCRSSFGDSATPRFAPPGGGG
jgi:hypothetical protein